ncbi:MAG: phosphoribosylanthranilate isomerase [Desulfobacteraceae bacterium]|nr:phosphoribosylanthranilate isomerase [Desulfobacteraceae bacterium]
MQNIPRVKVCGLTNIEQALKCAELGADAIGFVFYLKSPRNLADDMAREICSALPSEVKKVGVFVNETFSNIMRKAEHCNLDIVQLHGQESPQLVSRLCNENLMVVKALFTGREPFLEDVSGYAASAYLAECGKGVLPGGNALVWNWEKARSFGENNPLILAGGLSPDNVSHAVDACMPDAVDVSSGVESGPGQKDVAKVEAFLNAVAECFINREIRKIF